MLVKDQSQTLETQYCSWGTLHAQQDYFTALCGALVLIRNIREAKKTLIIVMILVPQTIFYFRLFICIIISLLNYFIHVIFKYAVLANKKN